MIQIEYKCTKKEFVRIFASWSHRSIEGNFPRVILLLSFIILGNMLINLNRELLLIFQGRYGGMLVFSLISSFAVVLLLLISIFFYEYRAVVYYWQRNTLIKEMGSCVKKITFFEEYAILEEKIFFEKTSKKLEYKEINKICICKTGIAFFENSMIMAICKNNFATEEDYKTVCRWLKRNKVNKREFKNLKSRSEDTLIKK